MRYSFRSPRHAPQDRSPACRWARMDFLDSAASVVDPAAPPELSPDGRWWWDGAAWTSIKARGAARNAARTARIDRARRPRPMRWLAHQDR